MSLAILFSRRSVRMLERNLMVYRHGWMVIFSGFFEPLLYLLGIGFGIGSLVRTVTENGHAIPYQVYVAPALMATSAMNGAIFEASFNFFEKIRYSKVFETVLSTPLGPEDLSLGEILWALIRGTLYSIGFFIVLVVLGLTRSTLAVLSIPAAMLVGFAFACVGSSITTFLRRWQDFDFVQVGLLPMFLFSGSFFPIGAYPPPLRIVVEALPLYHGIDLIRSLTLGTVSAAQLWDVAYLVALAVAGLLVTSARLRHLLVK